MDRGLACRDRCEPEVRRLLDLRDFSLAQPSMQKQILGRSHKSYLRSGLFFVLMGAAWFCWGYFHLADPFILVLGIIFAVYGAWHLIASRARTNQEQFRLCHTCGYNISGNTTGRCPECGHVV